MQYVNGWCLPRSGRRDILSVAITAFIFIGVILRIIVKIFKRFFKLWKNIFIFAGNMGNCLKFQAVSKYLSGQGEIPYRR